MKLRTPLCLGLLTIVLILSYGSCKKHKIKKQYTGDFLFRVNSTEQNFFTGIHHSNFEHPGTIEILKKAPKGYTKSKMYAKINYRGSEYEIADIDENGHLLFHSGGSGRFLDDDRVEFVCTPGSSVNGVMVVRDTVYGERR